MCCPFQPSAAKQAETGSEGVPEVVNAEGQMFADAKSYVIIEICLDRPLVPKREAEELAKRFACSVFL